MGVVNVLAEDEPPPDFDLRAVFAVEPRVKDPVRQTRGKNARQRGHKAEREAVRRIEAACNQAHVPLKDFPELRGTSNSMDFHWGSWACEVKSTLRTDGKFPSAGVRRKAWEQARNRCGWRTPAIVECTRRKGVLTQWRIWLHEEDKESTDFDLWISTVILGMKA